MKLKLLLVMVGILFSMICHGFTKRIIIASILSSFFSSMTVIIILSSVDPGGGTLRSALFVVGFPIYFFISIIVGLFYRILGHIVDKTTKTVNDDSPKKVKSIGRFIFKLAFNIGVLFILFVVTGNLPYVIENNINAGAGDAKANMDIKNAYTASQAYFTDYPDGTVSLSKITSYGFVQSSDVDLEVVSSRQKNLQITATHIKGSKTYTINSAGSISF